MLETRRARRVLYNAVEVKNTHMRSLDSTLKGRIKVMSMLECFRMGKVIHRACMIRARSPCWISVCRMQGSMQWYCSEQTQSGVSNDIDMVNTSTISYRASMTMTREYSSEPIVVPTVLRV
jgi:hypothetical protein